MMTEIKVIEKDTVHRICSGQVILNLATVVKELVENSIDAGSTCIEIRLKEYGSESIEVIDNGSGVHPDNFEALTLKHYTSKLKDFTDLVSIETYGFRGEALSSLCALSELSIITRHVTQMCGTKINFDHRGLIKETVPYARQVGTTVIVQNIFSTLPVRQKEFHRNLKREFSKMSQLLYAYCLVAVGIKIICVNHTNKNRLTVVSTQGNSTVWENMSSIFGSKQLSRLLEVVQHEPDEDTLAGFGIPGISKDTQEFKIEGYVSSCEHSYGRSSTDRQFCYINSRPCDLPKVLKVVNEVYHSFNQHQYPFLYLNIIMPKTSADINVTPDKRSIFVQNERLLLAILKVSLQKTFEKVPSTYRMNVPPSVQVPDESVVPVVSRSVPSLFNKWRHPSDKKYVEFMQVKRSAKISEVEKPNKQMKLDHVLQCTRTKRRLSPNQSTDDSVPPDDTFPNEDCVTTLCAAYDGADYDDKPDSVDLICRVREASEILCDKAMKNCTDQNKSNSLEANCSGSKNFEEAISEDSLEENCIDPEKSPIEELQKPIVLEEMGTFASKDKSVITEPKIETTVDRTEFVSSYQNRKCLHVDLNIEELKRKMFDKMKMEKTDPVFRNRFYTTIDPSKNELAETELSKEISKDMFAKMSIVGQFNLGFIITRLGQDLFIIDQHATDEKYNFEMLQRTTTLRSQQFVIPQALELTAVYESVLLENLDILKKNGFEFDVNLTEEPTKRVKLTSIPVSHTWQFGKSDVDELLFMLQDSPNTLCRPSRVRDMFASRACRKSVMIGTAISRSDMRKLVNHMGEIDHPWNCPHGRPTMRHLVNLSLLG